MCGPTSPLSGCRGIVLRIIVNALDGIGPMSSPPLATGVTEEQRCGEAWLPWVDIVGEYEVDDVVCFGLNRVNAHRKRLVDAVETAVHHLNLGWANQLFAAVVDPRRDLNDRHKRQLARLLVLAGCQDYLVPPPRPPILAPLGNMSSIAPGR